MNPLVPGSRGLPMKPAGGRAASDGPTYGPLLAMYIGMSALLLIGVRRFGPSPPRPTIGDVALIGLGTFKLSRLITKEKVLHPARAPFVEGVEPGVGSEINCEPAGTGVRRAIGELVTCPFCMSVWISTILVASFALVPRAVRLITSALAAIVVADASQYLYSDLREEAS